MCYQQPLKWDESHELLRIKVFKMFMKVFLKYYIICYNISKRQILDNREAHRQTDAHDIRLMVSNCLAS